jgi:hypothetical protein
MPLVFAFNYALQALRVIDVLLRNPTGSEGEMLLFHTDDPKEIPITHNGKKLVCKPDIVLVSLVAARNAFKLKGVTHSQNHTSPVPDTGSWDDYALNTARMAPGLPFTWRDCFSAVEVKRKTPKLPPPEDYTVKAVNVIRPLYKTVEERPAQGKCAQPSEGAMPIPLKGTAPVSRRSQLTTSY